MIERTELLVHAGAPSSRNDDERYRAQAQAYASFEGFAVNATGSIPPLRATSVIEYPIQKGSRLAGGDPLPEDEDKHSSTVFLEDTQLAFMALESQLLTSSLRLSPGGSIQAADVTFKQSRANLFLDRSSTKRKRINASGDAEGPQSSTVSNQNGRTESHRASMPSGEPLGVDVPSQTSYLKSPELQRSKKRTRVDDRSTVRLNEFETPVRDQTTPSKPRPEAQRIQAPPSSAPNVLEHSHDSAGGNQSTSELPTSYSLSDITSDSSKKRPNISQRSSSDPGPHIRSVSPSTLAAVPTPHKGFSHEPRLGNWAEQTRPSQLDLDPPPTGIAATHGPVGHDQHRNLIDTNIQLQSAGGNATEDNDVGHLAKPGVDLSVPRSLSVLVRPPQPKSSLQDFETHVTPALRGLVDDTDLNKSYKPVSVAREIRPLERGCWVVECPQDSTSWPLQAQIQFWQFLERTVKSGHVGWGVWCTRNDENENAIVDDERASLGAVKIFCWGEVVRHIYLLLYTGSGSKVRKLGLQWIDSEGHIVVQMRKQ